MNFSDLEIKQLAEFINEVNASQCEEVDSIAREIVDEAMKKLPISLTDRIFELKL